MNISGEIAWKDYGQDSGQDSGLDSGTQCSDFLYFSTNSASEDLSFPPRESKIEVDTSESRTLMVMTTTRTATKCRLSGMQNVIDRLKVR